MEHWINLSWPVDYWQLEKIYDFYEVRADAIIYHIKILGFNLTDCAIRGEIYDLNVSNRLASELGGPISAPEIVINHASDEYSEFTATCDAGLTATMQPYAQVEFSITDANGNKYTIMQQPIHFNYQRIIWTEESQNNSEESDGEDPLF